MLLNWEIRAVKCQECIFCQNRHRGLAVIVENHPVKHKASSSSYMSMFLSGDEQNTLDSKVRRNKKKTWLKNLSLQVNLCQKLLFLHQLTHNMTTDCSWITMNNLLSYCGLVDARIIVSEKDLAVSHAVQIGQNWKKLSNHWSNHAWVRSNSN